MIDFLIKICCGFAITSVAIILSLPRNNKTIPTVIILGRGGGNVISSQTFTVPPDVKTITITVGPMTGGGGPVTDETPARIPDDRP